MVAEDVMTDSPTCVRTDTTVREALAVLRDLSIRHLPVVDEDGQLAGMLSDRDLRALEIPDVVGDEYLGTVRRALGASVSQIMTADVFSVGRDADVEDVVELMLETRVGALPVVDDDGKVVGIVSYVDLLRAASFG